MKKHLRIHALKLAALFLFSLNIELEAQTVTTFSYTGSVQTWTVPPCVGTITVDVRGAKGGASTANYIGGNGGRIVAAISVTTGQVLEIRVGGAGSNGSTSSYAAGGYNGGGAGGYVSGSYGGGGGGGASDIRITPFNLTDRIVVAGGGGGGAYNYSTSNYDRGGPGGGTTGGSGFSGNNQGAGGSGTGGTQSGGGVGGTWTGYCTASNGASGVGGNAGTCGNTGGGGGGGYYGGGGGVWSGGGGGSSYALSTASNVTHTQDYQNGNGLVSITYALNGSIVNAIASPSVICAGSTATINSTGASSYTWSTGSNATSITVSPGSTTSYSVSGTNSIGCSSTFVINVPVDQAVPALSIVNSATNSSGICPGKTATLTASGATTYFWTGGIQNGVSFSPSTASGYTVTGTNACGTSTAATSISVHPQPTVSATPSANSVCTTQSVLVLASGNATSYVWSPAGIQNGVGFYPFNTQTYTVLATSALGCTNTAQTSISVVPTPAIPPLSTHSLVCIGESATITALGATNYSWEPQTSTASSIIVTPTVTTTYTLVKWNANCYDTQMITVIVNQLPTVFAIVNPTIVCASRPATLSAGGGVDYTWTTGTTTLASGPNAANVTVFPTQNTTYTVAASDGTCVNSTTIALPTNTNPIISLAPSSSVICAGESITFNVSGAESYGFSSNPTSAPQLTGTSTVLQLTTTTNYMVTGTNVSTGCWSGSQQVILVNPLPLINISASPVLVCKGFPSTLNATSLPQSPAHSYVWANSGPGSTSVVNPEVTTIYTVTGTNNTTGCSNTQTATVSVFQPTFSTTPDTAICIKGSITLIAGGALSYTWTGLQSQSPYVTVTPGAKTIYTVSATSQTVNGLKCVSSKTIEVNIYPKPIVTASSEKSVVCRNHSTELYATGAHTYTWITVNQLGDTITVSPMMEMTYSVVGADVFGCRDTSGIVVLFSNCPGFAENAPDKISIGVYPNPNEGTFVIEAFADMKLNLVNELGQVVREIILSQYNNRSVSVKDLAVGIYFITGQHENKLINQKVIIQ